MSNWLFPLATAQIPGVLMALTRTPVYATAVQTSSSGKEQRAQFQTYPRYKYHVGFEFVRTATQNATWAEFQQLLAMLQSHQGQFDNFLLRDPEDASVTGHGFGVGDNATLVFQLQRTLGGVRENYAGQFATANAPWRNVALYCRDFTNAAWAKTNVTAVKDQVGVDGILAAASSLTATSNNGTVLQAVTLASSVRATHASVRRLTGTGAVSMTTDGGATWTALTLTGPYARVAIPAQTLANPSFGFKLATSGDAIAVDLFVNETGTVAHVPAATTSSAVTTTPVYFPAYGDGFEPITDVFGDALIYKDGVLLTKTTDYAVSSTGLVTFVVAPGTGAVLTWTGSYLRRVRLAADEMAFERFGVGYWEQKGLDLISVK